MSEPMSPRDPERRPTHPGVILHEDVLPALGMTQGRFARALGVSRLSVNELLRERRALSAEIAARLGKALGTTAESWLAMQSTVDLWEITQNPGALADVRAVEAA